MQAPSQAGSMSEDKQHLILDVLQSNMKRIDIYESACFIAAGAIAGIIGLTNLKGLLYFIIASFVITASLGVKIKFQYHDKTNLSFPALWLNAMSSHILSFVLFWTLSYALVYIY